MKNEKPLEPPKNLSDEAHLAGEPLTDLVSFPTSGKISQGNLQVILRVSTVGMEAEGGFFPRERWERPRFQMRLCAMRHHLEHLSICVHMRADAPVAFS